MQSTPIMIKQLYKIDKLESIHKKLNEDQYKQHHQHINHFHPNKNNTKYNQDNIIMFIFIIFLLLHVSKCGSCTPKYLVQKLNVSLTSYCQLQFNQCESYQFQQCRFFKCPQNQNGKCYLNIKTDSQSMCQKYCCQNYNDQININSKNSINFCKSQLDKVNVVGSGVNKGIIFIWTVASIAIAAFIIICIVKCCKQSSQTNNTQFNIQHTTHPITNPTKSVNLAQYDIQQQGPYFINPQNSCAICLQNKVNLRTHCNHFYHGVCLLAWIQKKINNPCPLCMGINYNPVKVYCVQCKIGDRLVNIEANTGEGLIRDYDMHKCDNCKNIVSEVFTFSQEFQYQYEKKNKQDNINNINKQQMSNQVKKYQNNLVLKKNNYNQSQDNQIQSNNQNQNDNDNVIISKKYLKQRKQRRKNRKAQSQNKVIIRDRQLTQSQKNFKSKSNNNVQI